ncbi:polysaccharide deacetylase family protein [Streptomyces sp. ME02-6979-3A]|uniref:polysaccharide deacetylase family protein n=1 Tax=unclassified Streptomyces TaxID=2593676 RepID=UPI0029A5B6B2|nr:MULTISPECIES: polysaccharide deacetylase family protein [unclassified Streptomyces]MDX3323165.1 polysaccharide deacetylase family protein [Streptomyces sp. ME02-6979-3A]
MQLVRQNEKSATKRHRPFCLVLAALLIGAAASGCAGGADEGAGRGHDRVVGQPGAEAAQAGPAAAEAKAKAKAEQLKRQLAARVAVAKKWGLAKVPLAAPAPPAKKPHITTREGFEVEGGEKLPPVFTTVPTKERVVFLTMDDGAEKDPELLRMMSELNIPYSAFLSDYEVSDDYGYFKDMQARGVTLNNHTLNHRYLPGLSEEDQRREICGSQDKIEKFLGKRPTLFRPPYGNYNGATLRIAESCGIKAVPLWAAEAFPDHMEWREWDQDLHPGDIILTHFRGREDWDGSMADMIRNVMKTVTAKGYAVARLEDYV